MHSVYHILVVDDDLQILSGMAQILSKQFADQIVLHEAENGLSALRIIAEQPIDILVTDIKMPSFSGLDLIKRLEENASSVLSVVISGYQDYDLVRTAMKHGARDYLLKPVDIGELTHAIRTLFLEIGDVQAAESRAGIGLSYVAQQKIVQALLADSPQPLLQVLSEMQIPPDYQGCLYLLTSTSSRAIDSVEAIVNLCMRSFSLAPRKDAFLICGKAGEHYLLCDFSAPDASASRTLFAVALEQLRSFGLLLSANACYMPFHALGEQYHLQKQAAAHWFYDLPTREFIVSGTDLSDLRTHLIETILAGNEEAAIAELRILFGEINAAQAPRDETRRFLYTLFDELMRKSALFIRIIGKHKLSDLDVAEIIGTASSLSALRNAMIEAVYVYVREYRELIGQKDEYVIRSAKQYIHAHFAENLQLAEVAQKVNLHPSYFSSVFAAKTGTPFRNYLCELRIQRAQELLRTTNLKIYQVASLVGYVETAHFNRAFKKVTGLSPHLYKMGLSEHHDNTSH